MNSSLLQTSVDLSGLMRVLGEALYSTPYIAVRELVQNAHDSCERRRIEDPTPFEPTIDVRAEPGVLRIIDNGAGLTRDEIQRYLATVGAGYTRTLRDQGRGEGLIGYFGLGFLSAFVVSELTEVWTCSYQEPTAAHRFTSRSGETYALEAAEPRPVGSEVRLVLRAQFRTLSEPAVLTALLERYCCLLRFPVKVDGEQVVNAAVPPWRLGPEVSALRRRGLSLEFARRFERTFAPLATLPVGGGGARIEGLLWIQDGASYGTSDNRNVSVFVRGMLIGDNERDLLPRWAGFMGAVLESSELHPTASRESLIEDAEYKRAAQEVHEALVTGLATLAAAEPAAWRRVLVRHNEALLGAALGDPRLFDLVADDVTVPTTEGDLTVPAVLERSGGKLYIGQDEQTGVETILFRALRLPVVHGTRYGAMLFCRRYAERRRGAVALLGTESGDLLLFRDAGLGRGEVELLSSLFAAPDRQVLVRSFEPVSLPFVQVADRDVELKRRLESDEADRRISHAVLSLARSFTQRISAKAGQRMYVNAACPIIRALLGAEPKVRDRALALLRPLSSLLSDSKGKSDIESALEAYGAALVSMMRGED